MQPLKIDPKNAQNRPFGAKSTHTINLSGGIDREVDFGVGEMYFGRSERENRVRLTSLSPQVGALETVLVVLGDLVTVSLR